jgi:uncharacterized protein YacL
MSAEFNFRILGMFVCAILGARFGIFTSDSVNLPPDANALVFSLVGALTGLVLAPWVTTRPAWQLRRTLMESPIEVIIAAIVGLFLGLVMALLVAWPLSLLPDLFGIYTPLIAALVAAYFSVLVFASRAMDMWAFLRRMMGQEGKLGLSNNAYGGVLLDTSVIIDGRILELSKTGFIPGTIYVPQFVLAELQNIANSSDPLRRQRGRHGLDTLNKLKQEGTNVVQVIDDDPESSNLVDAKLVEVAKTRQIALMTNDYNLNGVATVNNVPVLNLNELSLALQPALLPGEEINVLIIAEGREQDQGVGYLRDGTMVVVENGRRYLDRTIRVVISRYIRSNAGKMYFAIPRDEARGLGVHDTHGG